MAQIDFSIVSAHRYHHLQSLSRLLLLSLLPPLLWRPCYLSLPIWRYQRVHWSSGSQLFPDRRRAADLIKVKTGAAATSARTTNPDQGTGCPVPQDSVGLVRHTMNPGMFQCKCFCNGAAAFDASSHQFITIHQRPVLSPATA